MKTEIILETLEEMTAIAASWVDFDIDNGFVKETDDEPQAVERARDVIANLRKEIAVGNSESEMLMTLKQVFARLPHPDDESTSCADVVMELTRLYEPIKNLIERTSKI